MYKLKILSDKQYNLKNYTFKDIDYFPYMLKIDSNKF